MKWGDDITGDLVQADLVITGYYGVYSHAAAPRFIPIVLNSKLNF